MPTNTIDQVHLAWSLGGTAYDCQTISAELALPGPGIGPTVKIACPDEEVHEPGADEDGSLTGSVYTDTSNGGVSWALATARDTGQLLPVVVTWFADQGPDVALQYTCQARVRRFSLVWNKPGLSKHQVELVLKKGTLGRPPAVA